MRLYSSVFLDCPTSYIFLGENDRIQGIGHGNQINGMCTVGSYVYTCGIDDSVKQIDAASKTYTGVDTKLASQPRGMGLKGDTIVTASVKEVHCYNLCCFLNCSKF